MKKDIILAGVGGQGIISIASIIGYAALEQGMFLKQSEAVSYTHLTLPTNREV